MIVCLIIFGLCIGLFLYGFLEDDLYEYNILPGIAVCLCLCFGILPLLPQHLFVDATIQKKQMEYNTLMLQVSALKDAGQSLLNEQEILFDDQDNKVRIDYYAITTAVNDWNEYVYEYQYAANNIWTNWYYSKKLADSLHYIEIE